MHGVSGAIDQVNQVVSGWDGHGARDFQVIMVLFVACGRDAPNGGWRNYMELLYMYGKMCIYLIYRINFLLYK